MLPNEGSATPTRGGSPLDRVADAFQYHQSGSWWVKQTVCVGVIHSKLYFSIINRIVVGEADRLCWRHPIKLYFSIINPDRGG